MSIVCAAIPAHAQSTSNATLCKRAIARAAATFERTKITLLQSCELQKRVGKKPAGTDCKVDQASRIATAQNSARITVAASCCGSDRACAIGSGGASDLSLQTIGWKGDGSPGNPVLAKQCTSGDRQGSQCDRELECPGICQGGAKDEESCSFNSSCANRVCVHANCSGGSQNGNPCDSDATKASCLSGGGSCNWLEECDGGATGGLGLCVGGTNANASCGAQSDCPGGTCDAGCNTGNLLDCVAGVCNGALCTANKDCGLCSTGPNVNQSCAADTDCGKECTGGSNDGTPCKTAADCTGGGTCNAITGSCGTGTCDTATGFCMAGSGLGALARSATFCAPADRCPNFENNKFSDVHTCNGGVNNGKTCTADTDCGGLLCNNDHTTICTSDAQCGTGSCQPSCQPGCSFALSNPADVANCVTCVGEAAVDQLDGLIYGQLKPAAKACIGGANAGLSCSSSADCPSSACVPMNARTESCKSTLSSVITNFFRVKRTLLQACQDAVLANVPGRGPTCPDTTAQTAISKTETALKAAAGKACGGNDGVFQSSLSAKPGPLNLDQKPDQISTVFTCPNFTAPGSVTCAAIAGQPVSSAEDLFTCLDCMTEFKVDCVDRLATPSAGALFPECNPLCGNGKIDGRCSNDSTKLCSSSLDCVNPGVCVPFETCDDGNAVSGDSCPANCVINSCTPSGHTRFALVAISAPAGVSVAGLSVLVTYPDGTVGIPGAASDQSVQDRVFAGFGGDGFVTVNDLNYALRVALAANPGAEVPMVAFGAMVDTCTGAPTATNDQFRCSVESAADANGGAITGVTCQVTIL
ncbi:MAG TPA: hypothetical protein VL403_00800 [Candidatus Kryptonia bacterium]|nr:hypothetical protein [Candidatus Kryptonia bacterium]